MPRYRDDYDDLRLNIRSHGPKPMSGLGLSSLLIAIGMGLILLVLIAILGILSEQNNGQLDDNDPVAVMLVVGVLGGLGMTVIGLVLGAVGCFQSDRSIILPVLGTVFNGLILLGALALGCLAAILDG